MALNLTDQVSFDKPLATTSSAHAVPLLQVREIAAVTKAVANGDLTKMVDIGASGEIRELKTTVNDMVRTCPTHPV